MSQGSAISFTRRQHRVLRHRLEEGRPLVEAVVAAPQRGGQVEAEAVDMHLADPEAQAVHHQRSTRGWRMSTVLPQPLWFS
jgi:hypothetical protein